MSCRPGGARQVAAVCERGRFDFAILPAGDRRQERDFVAVAALSPTSASSRRSPPPTSSARSRAAPASRRPARSTPLRRWPGLARPGPARRSRPGRAAGEQPDRSRACDAVRRLACRLVIGVGGGAFQPDVATLEVLVLPDRHDLLDALDRVAARRKRVGTVRRGGHDDDARLRRARAARSDGARRRAWIGQALPASSTMRFRARTASGS